MSSNFQPDNLKQSQLNVLTTEEKAEKRIYCISGLGADQRVFTKLKFKGYQPVYLDWLPPNQQESLADYAQRLAANIEDQEPILIGLSFGGMVATEIAKQIEVKQAILISTVKITPENPWYFRLFRWLPIHRLIPFKSLLWLVYWLINWFFSLETTEERKLLKAILIDTDAKFLKWAINQAIFWQNEIIPDHIYHIHGTGDRIFPLTFVEPDITIDKGGHFMIMNRADKISQIIDELLNQPDFEVNRSSGESETPYSTSG